jgi:2-polyprenyl-3-methyl-5-hydroxy-6-metoxy-1,4-benzoquinol methylase
MKTNPAAPKQNKYNYAKCDACNNPIPDSASRIITKTTNNTTIVYVQCPCCGLSSMHPNPSQKTIAEFYDADYYGLGETKFINWMDLIRGICLKRRAQRVFPMTAQKLNRTLDVGAGDGRFLKYMHNLGYEIYGTELPGPAYDRAALIKDINLFPCDIADAGFAPESFDIITIWHVLEHIREPSQTIRYCQTLLRPGGVLVIEVPNLGNWQSRATGNNAFHLDPPRHLYQFTDSSLSMLIENAHFEIYKRETSSLEMGIIGTIQSLLNTLITPRDLFYNMLRTRNKCNGTFLNKFLSIMLTTLIMPFAIIITLLEPVFRQGPVLRYFCRKTKPNEGDNPRIA